MQKYQSENSATGFRRCVCVLTYMGESSLEYREWRQGMDTVIQRNRSWIRLSLTTMCSHEDTIRGQGDGLYERRTRGY